MRIRFSMKKILLLLTVLIFLVISCGSSKKTENDTGILPDEDAVEEDDEEELEDESGESPDKDLTPGNVVCDPNPCEKIPNSTGRCEFDGDNSFICHCEKNYFWEDYKCISPCATNPCANVAHATGCRAEEKKVFECSCETNYFWDGERCVNPCEEDPCPEHSVCKPWRAGYGECICDENYFLWQRGCYNPCETNQCEGLANSTGVCVSESKNIYSCVCNENYLFDYEKKLCLSPCDPNICKERTNSTETCYTIDKDHYSCRCGDGFFWSEETEECLQEMPQCSPENTGLCKDYESSIIWSSRSNNGKRHGLEERITFKEAEDYCKNMKEGGFNDWRLPTIDELRTLVINCPGLESSGECKISEEPACLSPSCYDEDVCKCFSNSNSSTAFLKFGHEKNGSTYWSSSIVETDGNKSVWIMSYDSAEIREYETEKEETYVSARCVRR